MSEFDDFFERLMRNPAFRRYYRRSERKVEQGHTHPVPVKKRGQRRRRRRGG